MATTTPKPSPPVPTTALVAAVYARKSTDQNISDEEKSVTRQVERARAYAASKGWQVATEHIYQDDGVSGAEFVKRPGFLRLMNALAPRPPFQVLIISEPSRLGRDQYKTQMAFGEMAEAGVAIWSYLDDKQWTLDDATGKFMLSVANFAAELEREKARQRTYDAMRRKVERGHVGGGVVYGYDNVEVTSTGADGKPRRDHVVRRIHPEQAEVVRRLFQMTAAGLGLVRMAKTLTRDGVPPPRRNGRGWAPSAIRDMLRRPLYRGTIVWNKSQRIDRKGTRKKRRRDPSAWVTVEAPALRIVDERLWRAAQAALAGKAASYLRTTGGKLIGRPEGTRESPYLLTGIARCALCGGSIFCVTRSHHKHARTYYGCFYNRSRGALACPNALTAPMDETDPLVVEALARDVLQPHYVDQYLDAALAAYRAEAVPATQRRHTLEADLRTVEAEIIKLESDLASGAPWPLIREPLEARRRRRGDLRADLDQCATVVTLAQATDTRALREDLRERLTDWQGLLTRQPVHARQILKKLLAGRLAFHPFDDEHGRGYEIRGQASYGRLLAGIVHLPAGGGSLGVPPG